MTSLARVSSTLDTKTTQPSRERFSLLIDRLQIETGLKKDSRLWIAFSGGVDSTILLHAACVAFERARLGVIHVNHGLSPHAHAWENRCKETAVSLGIEYKTRSVQLQGNVEAAGRRERLRLFGELLDEHDVIVSGHHRDDEIESLLWQLSTGRALVGIAEWIELAKGRLFRPMLSLHRAEILAIAKAQKLTWIEDESNKDLSFSRNSLRHEIIPKLRLASAGFEHDLFRLKVPALEALARKPIQLDDARLEPLKVRAWLHAYGITPKESAVREVIRQSSAKEDANVVVRVSHNASVRRYKQKLYVVYEHSLDERDSMIVADFRNIPFDFGVLNWTQGHAGLNEKQTLGIRQRQGGERLTIDGRRLKLNEWFREQCVPPWERDVWPLFYRDEELVAVAGLGVSDHVRVADGWIPAWSRIDTNKPAN